MICQLVGKEYFLQKILAPNDFSDNFISPQLSGLVLGISLHYERQTNVIQSGHNPERPDQTQFGKVHFPAPFPSLSSAHRANR